MYLYASLASLGDDVYGEPATQALEAHVAQITGKEAGLFLPSGTMSNQIALRTHLKQPPFSVLCDHRAHINKCELFLYSTNYLNEPFFQVRSWRGSVPFWGRFNHCHSFKR